jgi:predicted secreted protein
MSADIFTVAKDEEFTISLQTIATAGYLWKIESLPDAIQLLGTENKRPTGDSKPGDPTSQVFRFRAREPGEHKIQFTLGRPWEKQTMDSRKVTVNVT